jgi:hypothetical protein
MDPKPVDLNMLERLGILGKAKQVMNVVESREPEKKSSKGKDFDPRDSYNQSMFVEENTYDNYEEKEPLYENQINVSNTIQNKDYTAEQVMASNLPPAVKEAMLKKPIPRLSGPPSKVTPEAIAKLTGAQTIKKEPKPLLTENKNSDLITLSRNDLQEIIDESINRFFKQTYNKVLTEETIKKTVATLLKEGKLIKKRG